MTKTMKLLVGAVVTAAATFVISVTLTAQPAPNKTVVGTNQVANPAQAFTAFTMITDNGRAYYRPADGSIVIDDVTKTVRAVLVAPPPPAVPLDQPPVVVSVQDPSIAANRSFIVPAVPAANSMVVLRNGLENYETIDFTTAAGPNSVTVTYPAGILSAGDTIAIRYKK